MLNYTSNNLSDQNLSDHFSFVQTSITNSGPDSVKEKKKKEIPCDSSGEKKSVVKEGQADI